MNLSWVGLKSTEGMGIHSNYTQVLDIYMYIYFNYIHHSLLGSSSSVSLSWSLANNVSGKLFIEQNQHMYVGYLGCDVEQSLISLTRGHNNFAGELEIPKLLI